ncbi:MAG: hypothetical protein ABSC08_12310 [Bryobacteraceae bacterium]
MQVLPLPGSDDSYAVIQAEAPELDTPNFDSVVVYDHDIRRPNIVDRNSILINSGSVSHDGSLMFGLDWESSRFEFSRLRIAADGAHLDKAVDGIGRAFFETMTCDDSLCATTTGSLVDGPTIQRRGRIPAGGPVIADHTLGRVYMLVSNSQTAELREYDAATVRVLRTATYPFAGPVYDLCRWADGQFAALTDQGIFLISGTALTSVPPPSPPAPVTTNGISKVGLPIISAVYDAKRNLIYGSVTGTGGSYANELVAIDPASGNVLKNLAVGSDPYQLHLTDDGGYLYMGYLTSDTVSRVNLDAWTLDFVCPVPGRATVLQPRPGHPDSFGLAVGPGRGSDVGFQVPSGFWMYQGCAQLPADQMNSPAWALAVDADTFITGQALLRLSSGSLVIDKTVTKPFTQGNGRVLANGLVYSDFGSIADVASLELKEQVDEYDLGYPDLVNGWIYYLRREGLRVYEASTLRIIGSVPLPLGDLRYQDPDATIFSCGANRIAVLVNGQLFILTPAAIQWTIPAAPKPVDRSTPGVLRIPMHLSAMLYDQLRQRLYVATPAQEGGYGNSVVAIDPINGNVVRTLYAGNAPSALAMPADASRIHVGLRGGRSIATIDLNTGRLTGRYPLPRVYPLEDYWSTGDFWPLGLDVMPGTTDVLAVSSYDGVTWSDWRQMILDPGGFMRPQYSGTSPLYIDQGRAIFFSPSGQRLQGFDVDRLSGNGRWSLPAGPDGLQYSPPAGRGYGVNVAHCGSTVFAASGDFFDSETLEPLGTVSLPADGILSLNRQTVACDPGSDRLYFLQQYSALIGGNVFNQARIHALKLSTRELTGTAQLPVSVGIATQMVALGPYGVACWFGTNPELEAVLPSPYNTLPDTDEVFIVSSLMFIKSNRPPPQLPHCPACRPATRPPVRGSAQ